MMREYTVKVVEEKIVYVEAETEEEAEQLAPEYAFSEAPDYIECYVLLNERG